MAGGQECESLFSLEVVVESVDNILISCYKPAIAFRLLDFPTVVIRSEGRGALTKDEKSLEIQSGKSCLFKISRELLYERLKNTPLYIMLVDTCSTTAKLLASTTISLLNCFQNVLENIERNGLDIPAVSGSVGEFPMYNLMGSQVATVKLRYRIFSFGLVMSGHVNPSLSKRIKRIEKENIVTEISPEKPERFKANGRFESPSLPYETENANAQDEELGVPDIAERENQIPLADAHTQTDINTRKYILTPPQKFDNPGSYNIHHHNNISRPPPLYYNSTSTFIEPKIQSVFSEKRKHLDYDLTEPKFMPATLAKPLQGTNVKINSQPQYCNASVQTCEVSCTPLRNNFSVPHADDNQMGLPLIEALLNELSLVRSKYVSNELPRQINERSTSPCNNKHEANIPRKNKVPLNKGQDKKGKAQKRTHPGPKKIIPTRANSKGVLISRQPIKFKKSSLKCGTTKTQRLREAFSKRNTNYGKHDIEIEAGNHEHVLSEQNEGKSSRQVNNDLQIDRVAGEKSEQDLKGNKSEFKDIGVQVRISGDTNQVDDDADKLSFGGNFSTVKQVEGPSTKRELLSNPSEFPTFSNVSPTVPVPRKTRYSINGEQSSGASQTKSRSSESRLSDKSLGLVRRPVGGMRSNRDRSGSEELQEKASFTGDGLSDESVGLVSEPVDKLQSRRDTFSNKASLGKPSSSGDDVLSDGSLRLVSKPVGEVRMRSNSDRSNSKESQGKRTSPSERLSDDSLGLIDKPISETNSFSDNSFKGSTRHKPASSDESPGLVSKAVGDEVSNSMRSSRESIHDKSICSDGKLSDKSLDLVHKPVGHVLSMSGYSDNFESDASDDTRDS